MRDTEKLTVLVLPFCWDLWAKEVKFGMWRSKALREATILNLNWLFYFWIAQNEQLSRQSHRVPPSWARFQNGMDSTSRHHKVMGIERIWCLSVKLQRRAATSVFHFYFLCTLVKSPFTSPTCDASLLKNGVLFTRGLPRKYKGLMLCCVQRDLSWVTAKHC